MLLIKASRDELLRPLQSVSGIVEKRHTLPILSNVLLERHGAELTLLATDIEIQIRTRTSAGESGGDGALTVSARKLQDILRSLPDSADVSLDAEDKKLSVRAGKSRFSLQTLPAQDYPRMSPAEGEGIDLQLSQKQFKRLLGLVQYAMAQQDIRYYLNGLLVVASGTELRVVATDGHRLATAVTPLAEPVTTRTEVIVPRKTILELSRLLADSDDALDIRLTGSQAQFAFGDIELVTKLIDGKFPDFERVIPQNHPNLVSIPRTELLPSLQRAAILTNEKFRGVRLVLTPGSLKLISTNTEQEEAQEEIEVAYQGDALDIGFNVTYLLDVLTHVDGETVDIRLNDSNSSALIALSGNEGFKYVVMPMRI
jgi:DNA polymerase-3 subunit beta